MIVQGFVGPGIPVWLRTFVTMSPALVVGTGIDSVRALAISQVVLSAVAALKAVCRRGPTGVPVHRAFSISSASR
ncbi:hypothetical protein [Burkholderia sp. AU39826]|uniref:hypothetical protein n=1 Tax=Burkholderia sp. AU39826 TaxID=2879634 RepID=UPI0039A410F7